MALRDLHRKIDNSVLQLYSWDDLDPGHGFHEVSPLPENDRVRFTLSETARKEILRRLDELNRKRYEEEVHKGLLGESDEVDDGDGDRHSIFGAIDA